MRCSVRQFIAAAVATGVVVFSATAFAATA